MSTPRRDIPTIEAVPVDADAERRLKRVRALAWFLDRAFALGGKRRFGLEPIIGLIPGIGDWIGGILSLYILYEGARLGLPWRVLSKMTGNILVETVVGTVPVLGDVVDFLWQANMRNVQLIETHYDGRRAGRPIGRIVVSLVIFGAVLFFLAMTLAFFVARWLWALLVHAPGPFGLGG